MPVAVLQHLYYHSYCLLFVIIIINVHRLLNNCENFFIALNTRFLYLLMLLCFNMVVGYFLRCSTYHRVFVDFCLSAIYLSVIQFAFQYTRNRKSMLFIFLLLVFVNLSHCFCVVEIYLTRTVSHLRLPRMLCKIFTASVHCSRCTSANCQTRC